ncbi:tetratricopeptide repeat protein [Streptomyces sp. UP1A-1]|nr:tetratricopeptide repeat protein [Streptomyces sp. UP1A-1]
MPCTWLGRHPEALQRYADLRWHLADELGLEPGPELRALHDGILRHDLPPLPLPGTAVTAGVGATSGSAAALDDVSGDTGTCAAAPPSGAAAIAGDASPVGDPQARDGDGAGHPLVHPAQLPGDLSVFAGRAAESAWLSAASGAPGRAGAGRSARRRHRRRPWSRQNDLRRPPRPPGRILLPRRAALRQSVRVPSARAEPWSPAMLCTAFSPLSASPPSAFLRTPPTAARSSAASWLGRRVLLVLDNARDEQQVRPLLPAGDGCLTLVTSRNRLPGLIAADGAKPLTLALPSETEAHETLARRLGPERLAAEPAAAAAIVRLCGRLPLALAVVAARAELDPAFPLQVIADDLRHAHGGLEAFTGFDTPTDVRSVFSWSYQSLDQPAAQLFRLLALHPGPEITALRPPASLIGLPLPTTRRLLAVLTRSCLVEQPVPGRYTLHDLLRGYATELIQVHDDAGARRSATVRVLDHYMFTAYEANRLFQQDSLPELDLGSPNEDVTPEDLTTVEQASRWLSTEHRVLAALLHTAVGQNLDLHITGLAWSLKEYLNRQEYWPEAITALTPALKAAIRRGDRLEEGRCLRHIGSIHGYLGHREEALRHLNQAIAIFEELGAVGEQARAHYGMACALHLFGRTPEAVASSERGLTLSRATGDELWTAECLVELAWFHSNLGQAEKALAFCQEAIALFQRLDAPWQQAQAWDAQGHILRQLGRNEDSVATYRQAVEAFEELGDQRNAVGALMRLGDTRLAMGDRKAARTAWVRALADAERQALVHSAQEVRERLTALGAEAELGGVSHGRD